MKPEDILQDRFALRLTAQLTQASEHLAPDITQRLRVARQQAIGQWRQARQRQSITQLALANASGSRESNWDWWGRMVGVVPLIGLVVGLVFIHEMQDDERVHELAQVDAALLADDLPPAAYTDPGFLQYLRTTTAQ